MKIDPQTTYTLLTIVEGGLLKQRNGKPYKSLTTVRHRLQMAGFKSEYSSEFNQAAYSIKGSDLIKLNSQNEQSKNSTRSGGVVGTSRPRHSANVPGTAGG